MSQLICEGASVIHKKYKWKNGIVTLYNPATGIIVVQQGAGGWAAIADEVDIVSYPKNQKVEGKRSNG